MRAATASRLRHLGARMFLGAGAAALVLGLALAHDVRWGVLLAPAVFVLMLGAVLLGIGIGARRP